MKNYGLKLSKRQDPNAYIFGSSPILAEILQPDGQWDAYLPSEELQNNNGVEPYACASYGSLNAIEILLKRKYGDTYNFSDRYLAWATGTQFKHGNDPHIVAEYLRNAGDVMQIDWDVTPDIDSFDKYYQAPPLDTQAHAPFFTKEFSFLHDYVRSEPNDLKEALKYSPLGFSATAWYVNASGVYYNPGLPNNHWLVCYGFLDGRYWKVFDSYDNTHKLIDWNSLPQAAKRYAIAKKSPTDQTRLELLMDKYRLLILLLKLQLKRLGYTLGYGL